MKKITGILLSAAIILVLSNCESTKESIDVTYYKDSLKISNNEKEVSISILKGKEFNHPTFVIWKEDNNGKFIETLFITKSYATGVFGHAALTDSTWDNKPGESIQPSALPYWTHKKGLIDNAVLVPTKEHPYIDGYTGATPIGDFKFDTKFKTEVEQYRIFVEVNQPWDWNSYWTNNKYPESESYKHSAQPSIIYAVSVNEDEKTYYMNPVGHGDPKGESGKLYTNLSTISSASNIFKSIKIEIQ